MSDNTVSDNTVSDSAAQTSTHPDAAARTAHAAIILAGGRGSRLGGADKASVEIEGRMLLDHVLDAVNGCAPIVVVGPPHLAQAPDRTAVTLVREDPPFTGPVAAIEAALVALATPLHPDETWLLACDLPRAAEIVAQLSTPIPRGYDAVVLVDAHGKTQWLAARYRTRVLRDAVATLPDTAGASMRQLLGSIRISLVPDHVGASVDLDTWAEISDYRSGKEEHHG